MDMLKYERRYNEQGYQVIAGIDEAGRGPLAGPVVAAAVYWGDANLIDGIKDSKKISEKKRLSLYHLILENAKDIGIGIVHEKEIDNINILQSTYLAMRIAIGKLNHKPDMLLIDGNRADINHYKYETIINGDNLSYSIAAASIIAKVTRDKLMCEYEKIFPKYGFAKHKGYGTKNHLLTIYENGACPIHRKSFKPIKSHLPSIQKLIQNDYIQTLGKELVGMELIRNNYLIMSFNEKYDVVAYKDQKLNIYIVKTFIEDETNNSKDDIRNINLSKEKLNILKEFKLDNIKSYILLDALVILKKNGPTIKFSTKDSYEI